MLFLKRIPNLKDNCYKKKQRQDIGESTFNLQFNLVSYISQEFDHKTAA